MKTVRILAAFCFLAHAAIAAPSLDERVLTLFEQKCAACHSDDEEPELSKSTKLSALRANDKYVIPGDSAASQLLKVLHLPADSKKRMPKSSKAKPLPPLNGDELALVKQWIEGEPSTGAGAATAGRGFVSAAMVDEAILEDLKKASQALGVKSRIRYLTLANLYNQRAANGTLRYTDADMDAFRTGVNKMLNSLSWQPEIILATPVDAAKVVLRIDLDAYGFSADIWHRLAVAYPYLIENDSKAAVEAKAIIKDLHVMRADYFTFVLAQPPFYHQALNLPGGTRQRRADVELEKRLGVVYGQHVKQPETVRAGFQKSGVSQGNRLIERLDRANGHYYWKSYDFDITRQNDRGGDLFRAPLGPIEAGLSQRQSMMFSADGGEIVFSLPNGLQAYMLIDANGVRLNEAPISVVTDKNRKDSRIINGISCIQCHREGMFHNGVKDEVLASSANLSLEAAEHGALTRLHNQANLERWFAQDVAHYLAAVAKCGPESRDEPIGMLYYGFANTLSVAQLSSELGCDPSLDLLAVLGRVQQPEIVNLVAKLKSGTPLPRQDFEKSFPALVTALDIGKVPQRENIALTEFGGDLDVNRFNRNESASGPIVKGSATKRDVILVDTRPAQPPAETPSPAPVSKANASAANPPTSKPTGVLRFDQNGLPITGATPPEEPKPVPAPVPQPARPVRRVDQNGQPVTTTAPQELAPAAPAGPAKPIRRIDENGRLVTTPPTPPKPPAAPEKTPPAKVVDENGKVVTPAPSESPSPSSASKDNAPPPKKPKLLQIDASGQPSPPGNDAPAKPEAPAKPDAPEKPEAPAKP